MSHCARAMRHPSLAVLVLIAAGCGGSGSSPPAAATQSGLDVGSAGQNLALTQGVESAVSTTFDFDVSARSRT